MRKLRKLKRPELWLEEHNTDRGVDMLIRIFYPDGESDFMTLNTYYNGGDVLITRNREWIASYGPKSNHGAWHPDEWKEGNKDSVITLLQRL